MKENRAIPQGYMTVGEFAKKVGVTVRTLQYYHTEGILIPSGASEGGRRLYTYKDLATLNHIQGLKYLGFSLEDIKTRLPKIDTPGEVSEAISQQIKGVKAQIKALKDTQRALEKFNAEVVQMDVVDWAQYASIIGALEEKNQGYWIMKYLSESVIEKSSTMDVDLAAEFNDKYSKVVKGFAKLQKQNIPPESPAAQAQAKAWWDFVMEFTKGNPQMLEEFVALGSSLEDEEWKDNFNFDKDYLGAALGAYFTALGIDPMGNGKGEEV